MIIFPMVLRKNYTSLSGCSERGKPRKQEYTLNNNMEHRNKNNP